MKFKAMLCAAAIAMATASSAVAGPAWEFDTPGNDFSNGVWNFG